MSLKLIFLGNSVLITPLYDDIKFGSYKETCSGDTLKFDLFSVEEKNNFRKRLLWQNQWQYTRFRFLYSMFPLACARVRAIE